MSNAIIETLLFLSVAGIIILMICVKQKLGKIERKNGPEDETDAPWSAQFLPDTESIVEDMIKKLGSEYRKENYGDDIHKFRLNFQHCDFNIYTSSEVSAVRLIYPAFFSTEATNLNYVRIATNETNVTYTDYKVVYIADDDSGQVYLHLMADINITEYNSKQYEDFCNMLKFSFEVVRNFNKNYDKICDTHVEDPEKLFAEHTHETEIVKKLEVGHFALAGKKTEYRQEAYTIGHVMQTIAESYHNEYTQLDIATDTVTHLDAPEEIAAFNLCAFMTRHAADGKAEFAHSYATLTLHILHPQEESKPHPICTISLQADGQTDDTLYVRAVVTMPARPASRSHSIPSATHPESFAFVMAYDRVGEEQRKAEAEYYWQEARDKKQAGKEDELTDAESLICDCLSPDVAYNLYWGRNYFLKSNYYNALLYLNNAYAYMNDRYQHLNEAERDRFGRIAYYMGLCYMKLGLYKQAYFYLDALFSQNNIGYATAYVNCLTNANDWRALSLIDSLLIHLDNSYDEKDEMPQSVASFEKFLKRRKIHAMVEQHKLEQAERLCEEMLSDSENGDYALSELTYIQQLRKEQAEGNNEL